MPEGREIVDTTGLLDRLEDPSEAMEAVGAVLLSSSQRAFQDKFFGEFRWPHRYPNQADPFLNIAGALSDLNKGRPVTNRRFQRQPVLRDTQQLFRSLSYRVSGRNRVQVGVLGSPAREYAGKHQTGGESKQTVTDTARKTLTRQLKKEGGSRKDALRKLGFIYSVPNIVTKVHKRPFVGVTPRAESEIQEVLADWGKGGQP